MIFLTFFERGSYKNQGIDMNFYGDRLAGVKNVHFKFQSPGHQEVCFYTVKYCKIAIFSSFLTLAATKINTMTWNYTWTNLQGWKTYMPNFKFPSHWKVCFYAVVYCKMVIFCTFFWAWLLQKSKHWHEIFQGRTSRGK